MATTKKTARRSKPTPPVQIEYDFGIKGERRTKEFEDAKEAKKFFWARKKVGKRPKMLKAENKDEAKPKVRAATEVDFGPATAPATKDKTKEPTKKTASKTPTVPGVRSIRTRPYLAGTIIAKHGLAIGVTDAMVAELDEAYGKPNPTESQFCLKNAWHTVRGYSGTAEDAL